MKKSMLSLIVLGLSFLFSTDESVFLKQVELENIYKFKIESFLEKIYDKSEYYVFADVRLEEKPKPNSGTKKSTSLDVEEEDSTDPFGYTFIEGLGLNPTLPTAPMGGNEKNIGNQKQEPSEEEYVMTGLNVSVYLAEDIYSVESRETITNFVNTNIDEIRNCFDCFVLEKMPNHLGRKKDAEMMTNQIQSAELEKLTKITSDYAALRDSLKWDLVTQQQNELKDELQKMIQQSERERNALIEKYESDQNIVTSKMDEAMAQKDLELKLILEAKDKELNFLIQQLDDATSARLFWEDQEARRNVLQNNLDSLKFINLMSIQDEYRAKQNQLLEDITSDYENSIQARINDAKGTEERLFKLIEGKNNNDQDVELEEFQKNSNRTSLYIIIGVVVLLLLLLLVFVLMKKNKKVVYLKPKGDKNVSSNENVSPPAPAPYTAPPTESNQNADVIKSEVKTLRQSAVTMSAGQKEGASQIISDWLDESSDNENSTEEDNSEKE
ncbi:MAG: hypothetical protein CMG05_02570 [Candidatus Marinimicrobia bacterium]|nr:hypothetical protein [Candidatus Neomarinimicrobiota bacterium]